MAVVVSLDLSRRGCRSVCVRLSSCFLVCLIVDVGLSVHVCRRVSWSVSPWVSVHDCCRFSWSVSPWVSVRLCMVVVVSLGPSYRGC